MEQSLDHAMEELWRPCVETNQDFTWVLLETYASREALALAEDLAM